MPHGKAATAPFREANWLRYREHFIMLLMAGYIIINVAVMLIRIPPVGVGLPIGEVTLLVFLATILPDLRYRKAFAQSFPMLALSVWWLVGIVHLMVEIPMYQFWAIRDSAHWMESNYMWIGFVVAMRPGFITRYERWFRNVLDIAVFYFLLYPARNVLMHITPKINSISGYSVSILFDYGNSSSIATMAGFFRIIVSRFTDEKYRITKFLCAVLSILFLIIFLQARVVYLQIMIVFAMIMIVRPQQLHRLALMIAIGIVLGAFMLSLNLNLPGRLGEKFTVDFLFNHIAAIWGGGDQSVKGAAAGVDLRVDWWIDIINRMGENLHTSLFGLGFGLPLTNFHGANGGNVREVHNSFMSVLGRLGPVGELCFLTFHVWFFSIGLRLTFLFKKLANWRMMVLVSTMITFMAMQILFSLVEGGFEVTYVCAPYYFVAGVLMAIHYQTRLMLAQRQRA